MTLAEPTDPGQSLWAPRGALVAFSAALLIFVGGVVTGHRDLVAPSTEVRYKGGARAPTVVAPSGRTLVILVDSCRPDFAFSDHMPFVSSCRDRGAWGISEIVSVPLSVACQRSIFEGIVEGGIVLNEWLMPSPRSQDNVFMRVTRGGRRVAILDWCLGAAYGKYADHCPFQTMAFKMREYREDALHVFEESHRYLSTHEWDFAVVAFYALDYVGHIESLSSPNYLPMAAKIDDYVRQLVGLTTEKDTVVFTAEHGMEDSGVHLARIPTVTDCPFILMGPQVRRGGPRRVIQIDWAPTLSLLAGVSPFYDSLALPNLDLIELSAAKRTALLRTFSRGITGAPGTGELDELRAKRMARMSRRGSPATAVTVALAVLTATALLGAVGVSRDFGVGSPRSDIWAMAGGVLGASTLIAVAMRFGAFDLVARWLPPFEASFIFEHPLGVGAALVLLGTASALYGKARERTSMGAGDAAVLLGVLLVFGSVLVGTSSLVASDWIKWLVLATPIAVWGLSRRSAWLAVFGATCLGLAIRRLGVSTGGLLGSVPLRWVLVTAVAGLGHIWAWWRRPAGGAEPVRFCFAYFIPSIAAVMWPCDAGIRTVLLVVCFVPVGILCAKRYEAWDIWLASWVTIFYLGTSCSSANATHLAALLLFPAVWQAARGTSVGLRGAMLALCVWNLYLMPGNWFSLGLAELKDGFIMGSVEESRIELTLLTIAARHILPAAIMFVGMIQVPPRPGALALASWAILPVIYAVGLWLASMLVWSGPLTQLWSGCDRVVVLLGYLVVVLGALLVGGASSLAYRRAPG